MCSQLPPGASLPIATPPSPEAFQISNFVIPVHLTTSPCVPSPFIFPGSQAACVVPALKMGHSVSMCMQLPPGVCVTPQVTGLQRRLWVKHHSFFVYTWWLLRMGVGGRGERWHGEKKGARVCVCVCVCVVCWMCLQGPGKDCLVPSCVPCVLSMEALWLWQSRGQHRGQRDGEGRLSSGGDFRMRAQAFSIMHPYQPTELPCHITV